MLRKQISRLTCLFLALLIIIGMLPVQAFAAFNMNAPETWSAPDSQYTAPGKKPVYVLLDYAQVTDGGIHASHLCTPGAHLLVDIVKATSTTGGHVKYTCDACGSWAQINVPALRLSAFTLNSAYQDMMENGVEFSGQPYTVVYDVAPSYQRYIGTELDNHVSVSETGLYSITITIESDIYERMEFLTDKKLRVYEKPVPWDFTFDNKIYDGTSLIAENTVSYTDVNGNTVPVPLSVYLAKVENGEYREDESRPVSNPVAAGLYVIKAAITDRNYIWKAGDETANTINVLAWVIPSASDIYVGEPMSSVQLETGNSAYSWSLDNTYTGFDSSSPGLTTVRANASGIGSVETPVIVAPRPILGVDHVSAHGSIGDLFASLNLPDTVTVTAKGTNENITISGVPVTWDSSVYNNNLLSQSIPGTLNLTGFSQLSTENIPAFSASVTLTHGSADTPEIQPFSKTYDGNADALPLPELPAGIASVNIRYKGASYAGSAYESTTPPVNAGSYNATAYFTMQTGYTQLPSVTVPYTISKATQTCPSPTFASATATSLTLNALENTEYSRDGNVWQSSPEFRNLDAGTTYTLYQRLKATDDGNYDVSPAASAQFSTEFTTVNPSDLNLLPQSYPYTGNPISYQVPSISHVARSTVTYTVDGQTTTAAPINAGTYPVTVSFTMQAGTAQLEPVNSTLTITKIEQNAPATPRASSTGTNSITVAAIPGAVFSMDGETWQNSTIFEGLTPDTAYTIRAKYPEDRNHYESPISSSVIRTTRQNASAATVQSAVYTYDGTPKSLVAEVPLGCTEVVQSFTGKNGTSYGPTTESPVNPGVYNVRVSYTMRDGYEELQPQYATLTIQKATPAMPLAPVVTGVTDSSITIKVEDGMAYSIDGGVTWQTTDTFAGLNRDTTYEIKVKAVETTCYKEQEGPSTMQATNKTVVTFEQFVDQTVEYTGHAQTYTLPRSNPGISSMAITGYDGISTPPSNVGSYTVNIDFVAADGFKLPETLPAPKLNIIRPTGEAGILRPLLVDETVTYTGNPQRYHGADNINGIASVLLTYEGIGGTNYASTSTAPTNAGTYSVTAVFSPDTNHILADGNYTSTLIIRKAAQDTPMASLESSSAHSLTVSAIPGAEYSIDGGNTWQNGNSFGGLNANENCTILVRMKEDENHFPSGTRPVPGRTTEKPVDIGDGDKMPSYTTVYNGNRQPYPYTNLLSEMEGVKSVSVMYVGTLASGKPYERSEAPVDAGIYKVRFYLTAKDNYDLKTEQIYADMTIQKAPQAMDTAPTIARRTTTTIALNPVPGAEYSIDGGMTWQDNPKFIGLTPDTVYTFMQRLKETDNLYASDAQTVEGRTIADTGLNYEIDFRKETISFDPDVVEIGKDYTLSDKILNGGAVIPGSTIYVRLVDDGTGSSGAVVMDTLPERPATPSVKVNPFDFIMNTSPDMEYSDNGGETWTPCEESPSVENRQGEMLLVRIAATEDSFRSEACTVIVPVRGAAPVLEVENASETLNSTAAMEHSRDNGETWISCTDGMSLSDLTSETLLIRYACDGINPASHTAFVRVPSRNPAPNASISTVTERLTATGTHPEYRTENEWIEIPADGLNVSDLCGQEVAVRESYDTEHFASLPVMTTVPKRGAIPDLSIDRDKQTINTTGDMEYSTDGGMTWVKCDPDMDVSDLTGQTILVHKAANDYEFASDSVEVKIPNRTENSSAVLDTNMETVNTTSDMDYSTDGGKTWNPCTEPLDVSDLTGQTIVIRNHGDENSFPSSGVEVKIPVRRDAPHVEVDGAAKAIISASGTEFSSDDGKTWTALTDALNTKDYRGKTLLFRYPASADEFVSRNVVVLISNNPDAPVLVFDPNTETINTTPDMEYSDDGGKTWKPCPEPLDVSELDGKEILIRYPGKDGVPPSEAISVRIPTRRAAPDVGHTDETAKGKNDGSLTDTDRTMEYRVSGGKWISIAGKSVKNLAPDSYEVRYKATANEMASKIQKVKIKQGGIGSENTNNGNSGNNSSNNNSVSGSGSKLSLLNRADHFAYIVGRTSTQAAPTADITRAEVASILYRLLTDKAKSVYGTNINHFKDVPANAWYSTAVSTLANLGVISGYPNGTFGPNKNISRAELASILARFCGNSNTQIADKFTDVSESWARKFINQAAAAGLVYGYENGTFRPNQNITRAETIAMVNRILNRKASADAVVTGYKTFTDVPTGKWFYWDIIEASNAHNFTMSNAAEKWTALK